MGWTIAYFIIAGLFCIGLTEPGLMAASFFLALAFGNFFFDRLDKPRKGR